MDIQIGGRSLEFRCLVSSAVLSEMNVPAFGTSYLPLPIQACKVDDYSEIDLGVTMKAIQRFQLTQHAASCLFQNYISIRAYYMSCYALHQSTIQYQIFFKILVFLYESLNEK